MNFSFGSLVASIFVSGAGFVFFKYGRKKSNGLFAVIGIVMMVYPYFIDDVLWMIGIAVLLMGLLYGSSQRKY